MKQQKLHLRGPNPVDTLAEFRALGDLFSGVAADLKSAASNKGRQHQPIPGNPPVLLIPGFGGGERSMSLLGRHLNRNGYRTFGWGLGRNLAGQNLDTPVDWDVPEDFVDRGELGVPRLVLMLAEKVRSQAVEFGEPVALVGWSLGGYLAREVAREVPEVIQQVVTMGAPVHGGPKYTAVARAFRRRGIDVDWIESEVAKRYTSPIYCPITSIVSRSDGVVGFSAATDNIERQTKTIVVNCSHAGLGMRPEIWKMVSDALDDNRDWDGTCCSQRRSNG